MSDAKTAHDLFRETAQIAIDIRRGFEDGPAPPSNGNIGSGAADLGDIETWDLRWPKSGGALPCNPQSLVGHIHAPWTGGRGGAHTAAAEPPETPSAASSLRLRMEFERVRYGVEAAQRRLEEIELPAPLWSHLPAARIEAVESLTQAEGELAAFLGSLACWVERRVREKRYRIRGRGDLGTPSTRLMKPGECRSLEFDLSVKNLVRFGDGNQLFDAALERVPDWRPAKPNKQSLTSAKARAQVVEWLRTEKDRIGDFPSENALLKHEFPIHVPKRKRQDIRNGLVEGPNPRGRPRKNRLDPD